MKDFTAIWNEANSAGRKAVEATQVAPMVVEQHENQLDDNSPVVKSWFEADGVCGFAWLEIRPASRAGLKDCDLVKWLRANGIGRFDDYTKAWSYWIGEYNQSMQKKEAHAEAMARVLRNYGYRAYAMSRMD